MDGGKGSGKKGSGRGTAVSASGTAGGGKGIGKGAAGTAGGGGRVPQAQQLTGAGRPWSFFPPWWRDMQEDHPDFRGLVLELEIVWTNLEEHLRVLCNMLGEAHQRGDERMANALRAMTESTYDEWESDEMGFWNWCVRLRNRRASGTGRLTVQRWEGMTYIVDPLTGWWIEEPYPDEDADIV